MTIIISGPAYQARLRSECANPTTGSDLLALASAMNLVEQRPLTISFTPHDSQLHRRTVPLIIVRFDAQQIVEELTNGDRAQRPTEFLATDGKGLLHPGLYSWWADDDGATDLSEGLGIEVSPGPIYAGQAGSTRA